MLLLICMRDEDTNYNYEKGIFATIQIDYNEDDRSLTINDRKGEFPGMLQKGYSILSGSQK